MVALSDVAAEAAQGGQDLLGLDALGDKREAEVVAEVDNALYDQRVAGVLSHGHDEGPVDLELADRQVLELAEAGVSDPEVVDGDSDPEGGQLLQQVLRPRRLGHDRGLGHLELEQLGVHTVRGEELGDQAR